MTFRKLKKTLVATVIAVAMSLSGFSTVAAEEVVTEDYIIESDNTFTDEALMIAEANAEHTETISYYVHQQGYGDTTAVTAGEVAGNAGTNKRLEAFYLTRTSAETSEIEGDIRYQAHCQSVGWTDWVTDGAMAGTSGKSKRMEAIKIELTGELAEQFDIYYKTYMSNCGWLDWAKNGELSGTEGYGATIEAVMVLLVVKDSENAPQQGRYASITPEKMNDISYSGHVQTYGDLDAVSNGATLGTTGKAKRLEALKVKVSHEADEIYGTVKYSVHCQTYGWMGEVSEKKLAGTTGQSKRLEAITVSLSGDLATYCDVYYRVHCQRLGWLGWAKNGAKAGTAGYSYRMEAIQIKIVPKGSAAPGKTSGCYYDSSDKSTALPGYALLEPYLDDIIAKYTNSSMTKEQKLRALYDYSRTSFTYVTLSNDCPPEFLFHEYYAYQRVTTGTGNCYGVNFLFGHLAKKIGYTDVKFFKGYVLRSRAPHGWVEIDGLIYDPELHWKNGREFFGVKNFDPYDYYYN